MPTIPRHDYPIWVKLSLWGLPTRTAVWAFVWLSIALAVGCVGYAILARDPRLFLGALFVGAAWPYWRAIRWVDQHGSWDAGT